MNRYREACRSRSNSPACALARPGPRRRVVGRCLLSKYECNCTFYGLTLLHIHHSLTTPLPPATDATNSPGHISRPCRPAAHSGICNHGNPKYYRQPAELGFARSLHGDVTTKRRFFTAQERNRSCRIVCPRWHACRWIPSHRTGRRRAHR
jgi:hypothetical protein